MKKLDLNVEIDEKELRAEKRKCTNCGNEIILQEKQEKFKVIIDLIGNMIARALNKPDSKTGQPKQSNMDVHRKYNKIMDIIESHKEGIIDIEDDDLNYIVNKFNFESEVTVNRSLSRLLSNISKRLDEAKK